MLSLSELIELRIIIKAKDAQHIEPFKYHKDFVYSLEQHNLFLMLLADKIEELENLKTKGVA